MTTGCYRAAGTRRARAVAGWRRRPRPGRLLAGRRPRRRIRSASGSKASSPRSIAAAATRRAPTRSRRSEDAVNKQQADLDRLVAQARRLGCEGGGFFSLFSGQPPQCGPLNKQIQQMRGNLDRMLADLQRLQGSGGDRESQRQTVIAALAQNNCGPQYRAAANQQRGFFDTLFGGGHGTTLRRRRTACRSATYRTVCVRTCDGYYFPISFATTPAQLRRRRADLPAHVPGRRGRALLPPQSGRGRRRRRSRSPASPIPSCRTRSATGRRSTRPAAAARPGQSWAEALGQVTTTRRSSAATSS